MITDNMRNTLIIESKLSNTFTMAKDSDGILWVIFDNFIVDHLTFKSILIWNIVGHNCYQGIMECRKDHIDFLKKINNISDEFMSPYGLIGFLCYKFKLLTKGESTTELVNRYEQYISD